MESREEFRAYDMPDASRFTLHILAAVAEHERDMVSERTKAALKAAKARGVHQGSPNIQRRWGKRAAPRPSRQLIGSRKESGRSWKVCGMRA